jgi:hypothetical protein
MTSLSIRLFSLSLTLRHNKLERLSLSCFFIIVLFFPTGQELHTDKLLRLALPLVRLELRNVTGTNGLAYFAGDCQCGAQALFDHVSGVNRSGALHGAHYKQILITITKRSSLLVSEC